MSSTDSTSQDGDTPTTRPIEQAMLDVLQRASVTSLSPPEIAQKLHPEGDWHAMLTPIRRAAIALAVQGRLIIYRKGKPVDPENFSGVYRIGLPRHD